MKSRNRPAIDLLEKMKLPPAAVFLNEKEAAGLVGFSHRTLQDYRLRGIGPAYRRLGPRRVIYVLSDLQAWSDANMHVNSSAEAARALRT